MNVYYLYDSKGKLSFVQISPDLWRKLEPLAKKFLADEPESTEDLESFADFLRVWDFRYSYDPAVRCPNCQAFSQNWQLDEPRQFLLHNANIGGLLVFHCQTCGATIRHKYFKDHQQVEATPPAAL